MNIVFDLDGTLIDSRTRLYRLFQRLAPAAVLSYDQYWTLKRSRISNEIILSSRLGYGKPEVASFVEAWMAAIESPEMLDMDSNFPGMHASLARLSGQAHLHVCTARQHRDPVLVQLDRLGLLHFFSKILVTEQKNSKEHLIGTHIMALSTQDWLLGDTGKDIQAGKSLNMKTCAVSSGFMSREALLDYAPDLMLESAADFVLQAQPA